MTITETNVLTGEVTVRDLTPEEEAQLLADQEEHAARESIIATVSANRGTLEAQATAAIAQNQAAIGADPGAVSLAQVAAQVQALSAQNNALIRLVLGLLEETD